MNNKTIYVPNKHDKMEVVFNQFFGLGDIIFIEPLYRMYHELEYRVVAPVNDEYYWIKDYIPYVDFRKKSEFKYSYETVEQPDDGRLHLPTRFSHPLYRGHDLHYGDDRGNWMRDKYLYLGLDEWMWKTMKWERKAQRENDLFSQLGIKGEYNLINEHFGGTFERVAINPNNGLQNVYVERVGNFTLLDWALVIEMASNIYVVDSSIVWPIEVLDTRAKELHIYPRYPFLEDVNYFKDQFTKNWIFHDSTTL
jgi:hypothetical protein